MEENEFEGFLLTKVKDYNFVVSLQKLSIYYAIPLMFIVSD